MQLIRLSPSALAHALTPDELIVTHRVIQPQIAGENFDLQDRQTFLRHLVDLLNQDFSSSHLKRYFYELRGLREIETVRTVAVKSAHQIVLQRNIQQRHGLGQLAEAHGGGYIHILVVDNAPQPWEPGGIGNPAPPAPVVPNADAPAPEGHAHHETIYTYPGGSYLKLCRNPQGQDNVGYICNQHPNGNHYGKIVIYTELWRMLNNAGCNLASNLERHGLHGEPPMQTGQIRIHRPAGNSPQAAVAWLRQYLNVVEE